MNSPQLLSRARARFASSLTPYLSIAIAALGLTTSAPALAATDPGCTQLGGNDSTGECRISGSVTTPPSASVTLNEDLHVLSTGRIIVPAAGTLNLTVNGDLEMDIGAQINGNGPGVNKKGANLNITVSGHVILHGDGMSSGASITAEQTGGSCSGGRAGNITLTSNLPANANDVSILVEGGSRISVNGATCPAGSISIAGARKVDIDGTVESAVDTGLTGSGQDRTDGGPISIKAGCSLLVSAGGKVSSRGRDNGADLVYLEGGCAVDILGVVESIATASGGHASAPNHCNADNTVAHPLVQVNGKGQFAACVQLVSGGHLLIDGPSGGEVSADGIQAPNRAWVDLFSAQDLTITGDSSEYAVHANGDSATNTFGGVITIKSQLGKVVASGFAIQADATSAGSHGGNIRIEAGQALALDKAVVSAQGDGNPGGGYGYGGVITTRSFSGNQSWNNGAATVQPTGSAVTPANQIGVVTFQVCSTGSEGHVGTSFPVTSGSQTNPVIDSSLGNCGGSPSIPVALPTCSCTVLAEEPFCEKAPVKALLDPASGRFPGNAGMDVIVKTHHGESIQTALDNAQDVNGDGYLLVGVVARDNGLLGGHVAENITISSAYSEPFALIGCSVTLHSVRGGVPTAYITSSADAPLPPGSTGNIFVMDLHATDSTAEGWRVEGNGRYLRNVGNGGKQNNAIGIHFVGNNNTMHNGAAQFNKNVGLLIEGHGNLVDSSDSFGNGGCGIQVVGNTNTIKKTDLGDRNKGNGAGLCVAGNSNTLSENDAFANAGDGIWVSGNSNLLSRNRGGEDKKGNGLDGIRVAGVGNSLTENQASGNGGDGFDVSGGSQASPNVLKNNQSNTSDSMDSGENAGAEYRMAGVIKSLDGNKADKVKLPTAGKCSVFPAANKTVNFTSSTACE